MPDLRNGAWRPEALWAHVRGGRLGAALHRVLEPRALGPLVGAIAFALGLFAIHAIKGRIHPDAVRAALAAIPGSVLALALLCTALSVGAMSCYDVVVLRRVEPEKATRRLACFAAFVAYGFANTLGFHVFIGGPLRYRIYQTAGMDAAHVGRIVALSLLTAWGGVITLGGAALALAPPGLAVLQVLSPTGERVLGVAILLGVAAFLAWLGGGARQFSALGWSVRLPAPRQALAQIALGAVDYAAAAAALYVLLPPDVRGGATAFLALYIVAVVISAASHAPGGLGVFEATMLIGLGVGTRADVVAALLVFRIVYYLLPLLLAALALLFFEARRIRARVPDVARRALVLTRHLVPPLAATFTFVGGAILLLSASTPDSGARVAWLRANLPLPFAEASHLLASLTGLLLIVIARGLLRRLAAAHVVAVVLLVAGAVFSLFKSADWQGAAALLAGAAVLAAYRRAFYRGGGWRTVRPDPAWIALAFIVVVTALVVGLIAYRHVGYRSELWWQFSTRDDLSRFLRATLILLVAVGALALDALLNRPRRPPSLAAEPAPDAVRALLARSTSTESSVALLGDKRFLLAPADNAFLMYGVSGHSWVALGDPVGDEHAGHGLIWRFVEEADRAGARAVFYAIPPESLPRYLDMNMALLKIGEVARVDLAGYTLAGAKRSGLRQAKSRAERDGLEFAVVPAADVPALLPELRAVSDTWLASKHGREKGFSIGRFEDGYVAAFDCAVFRKDGRVVAFANLWRSGDGQEIAIDLMRYLPGATKMPMEALFANLFVHAAGAGYRWFNLGAAPLSGLATHPLASTWDRIGTFIYRQGDEFYNFSGLRHFKQKFDPVWTPQYLAAPGGFALTRALADVTVLIAGGALGVFKR